MINVTKLSQELVLAGITTHGNCNSNGVVWDDNNNEIQDRLDVKAVLAKHDPTPEILKSDKDVIQELKVRLDKLEGKK